MRQELYLLATDKINGFIPTIIKFLLFLFSLVYGVCVRLILLCYKRGILKTRCLDCKVISVGNITLGGTGKTTLVEYLSSYFYKQGLATGILSRGYKRHRLEAAEGNYKAMGDEPYMLSLNNPQIPIAVGEDRFARGRQLLDKYELRIILLDDGFQHWRLKRDLDIVLIDAANSFGNRHLIPRGVLREPLSSLKRADIFVISKSDTAGINLEMLRSLLIKINSRALIVEAVYNPVYFYELKYIDRREERPRIPLADIECKDVCILCSIANPEYFQQMIMRLGLNPSLKLYFPDHYEYKSHHLETAFQACSKNDIRAIITTEKDAVKLKELNIDFAKGPCVLVLKIEFKITQNEDGFFDRLSSIYKR
jgi:tetraacyldisaccharide 4'-kinase